MKWFMPPTLMSGSNRQAETHEPSTVRTTAGRRLAKTPPMWMLASVTAASILTARPRVAQAVNGAAQRHEHVGEPLQALRVADHETAVGLEVAGQPLEQAPLGRAIEIDDHVAAKDDVEARPDRPGLLGEIDSAERDEIAELRAHLVVARPL